MGWKLNQSQSSEMETKIKQQTNSGNNNNEVSEIERLEIFIPEEPKRSLDEVILSSSVFSRLKIALNRILYHEKLYEEWNLKKLILMVVG